MFSIINTSLETNLCWCDFISFNLWSIFTLYGLFLEMMCARIQFSMVEVHSYVLQKHICRDLFQQTCCLFLYFRGNLFLPFLPKKCLLNCHESHDRPNKSLMFNHKNVLVFWALVSIFQAWICLVQQYLLKWHPCLHTSRKLTGNRKVGKILVKQLHFAWNVTEFPLRGRHPFASSCPLPSASTSATSATGQSTNSQRSEGNTHSLTTWIPEQFFSIVQALLWFKQEPKSCFD